MYYWLKTPATQPVKIELLDNAGAVKACLASDTPVHPVDTEAINVQAIWQQPTDPPSAAAGMHRVALSSGGGRAGACAPATPEPAPAGRGGRGGRGAASLEPGRFSVRLTVDGQAFTQPVTIKPDPRNIPN